MFICSVSTVIFNANPLLRYDGYYILADLMEIPNLRQKATHDSQPQAGRTGAWAWRSRTIRSCRSATRCSSPCTRSPRPSIAG